MSGARPDAGVNMNAVVDNLAAETLEMPVPLIFTDSAAAKVKPY